MITALRRAYSNFRGLDLTHSAVPPMEGPLKPNTALDAAPAAATIPGVDNLVATPGGIVCSSGKELLTLEARPRPGTAVPGLAIAARLSFEAEISCLASDGGEALAIGLDGDGITISGGKHDGRKIADIGGSRLTCPTAALFVDPDTLVVANGSADYAAADWKRDLMNEGRSGSVWRIDLARTGNGAGSGCLADDLAFPTGIASAPEGGFFVAEAWRYRVVRVGRDGDRPAPALADLPAYPGRLLSTANGDIWLALFAPRNSLVEFVILEKAYRERMMAQIDPDYWIAPALSSGRSYLEPIQGSARKKLNMLKPWSATWSYGLVARCDAAMRPLASFHSRADGNVHGVTSLCEWDGMVFAGAKGAGVVVVLQTDRPAGGSA
jgi:hypothetical protein